MQKIAFLMPTWVWGVTTILSYVLIVRFSAPFFRNDARRVKYDIRRGVDPRQAYAEGVRRYIRWVKDSSGVMLSLAGLLVSLGMLVTATWHP